jgi:hypothetical protein
MKRFLYTISFLIAVLFCYATYLVGVFTWGDYQLDCVNSSYLQTEDYTSTADCQRSQLFSFAIIGTGSLIFGVIFTGLTFWLKRKLRPLKIPFPKVLRIGTGMSAFTIFAFTALLMLGVGQEYHEDCLQAEYRATEGYANLRECQYDTIENALAVIPLGFLLAFSFTKSTYNLSRQISPQDSVQHWLLTKNLPPLFYLVGGILFLPGMIDSPLIIRAFFVIGGFWIFMIGTVIAKIQSDHEGKSELRPHRGVWILPVMAIAPACVYTFFFAILLSQLDYAKIILQIFGWGFLLILAVPHEIAPFFFYKKQEE